MTYVCRSTKAAAAVVAAAPVVVADPFADVVAEARLQAADPFADVVAEAHLQAAEEIAEEPQAVRVGVKRSFADFNIIDLTDNSIIDLTN